MTVFELIDMLVKIENKKASIYIEDEYGKDLNILSISEPTHTANIIEIKLG